jgi:hypothetical protein
LSAEDICKIIAECRSANVSEIKFEGIHIVFNSPRNEILEPRQGLDQAGIKPIEIIENEEAKLMNEQALLDATDAQILIDDPLEFERLNTRTDLERNRVLGI